MKYYTKSYVVLGLHYTFIYPVNAWVGNYEGEIINYNN